MSKIGLALSGGGIRGIAHLGVLQCLTEIGIKPSIIAGTSAGSLVGTFYAEGYAPKEILKISKSEKFFNFSSFKILNGGLFSTNIFEQISKKYISHDKLELLNIPTFVTATDLTNAKLLVLNSGSIATAVKASCCVPLVFQPVLREGAYLSDGGILNNFPIEPLENKCDKIIGVYVNSLKKIEGKMSYKDIVERTLQISLINNVNNKKEKCHVYIEPPNMSNFSTFDFNKIDEIYNAGYSQALLQKKELLKLLS